VIGPEKGRPYWNPYLAGVALGAAVTASFALGHYFGASRVFATAARWLRGDEVKLDFWMSWEVLGLAVGGALGSLLAGRWGASPGLGGRRRVISALVGGALVMIGSRFAAGCTSGLALTGGIRMSVGAYVFMGAMFLGGFAAAAMARRVWS
jgi:uncharacterized membrane protein YedE/YeeE